MSNQLLITMNSKIFQGMLLLFVTCVASIGRADDQLDPPLTGERFEDVLFSGRVEGVFRRSFENSIREGSDDHNKAYFNSVYLNAEGPLSDSIDFLVEFQPYVSDLYLLGGFVSVAGPLEGIGAGDEEVGPRAAVISEAAKRRIEILDEAADRPSAERIELDFAFHDGYGVRVGRVRNPWGFWDDYSLFRNLSAGKTDPVTLGVQLRRADYGVVGYGELSEHLSYELGVLSGEMAIDSFDSDSAKDVVGRLNYRFGRNDFGVNYYRHDLGQSGGPLHAGGAFWRLGLTYDITLLGEYIYMSNSELDVITRSCYLQVNYNLSEVLLDGLRWNTFFESYNSDLLKVDFDDEISYRYAGTILRGSTGVLYAVTRAIDVGAQAVIGKDEEGDNTLEMAFKVDVQF